jgi:hypothetical protein
MTRLFILFSGTWNMGSRTGYKTVTSERLS